MSNSEFPSDWHRESYIEALKRERLGYEARGDQDGLAAVDKELVRLGVTRAAARGTERATRKPKETR